MVNPETHIYTGYRYSIPYGPTNEVICQTSKLFKTCLKQTRQDTWYEDVLLLIVPYRYLATNKAAPTRQNSWNPAEYRLPHSTQAIIVTHPLRRIKKTIFSTTGGVQKTPSDSSRGWWSRRDHPNVAVFVVCTPPRCGDNRLRSLHQRAYCLACCTVDEIQGRSRNCIYMYIYICVNQQSCVNSPSS